jgi:hypothetical protein
MESIESHIYRFSPERFCSGFSPHGGVSTLKANSSNLPEVLSTLQPVPKKFREFNELVSRVLPQVRWVSTHPRAEGNEILIWPLEHTLGREDLAVPLEDCGTGVGHVLAILYVLFTSITPQTILIDEPQSFLHPGAARRLMDTFGEFPRHHLLIATHSPTIISAPAVSQVLCLELARSTTIKTMDVTGASHRAYLLNDLGARLADVSGADNILWVEGPTEEECFPKILQTLVPGVLSGTAILAVRKTGDLEGKDAERVFEIYRSLSSSGSLLPPTLGFLFDRECWTEERLRELITKSTGLLKTTMRRTYENYLLHPAAIAAVINADDLQGGAVLNSDEVQRILDELSAQTKYSCAAPPSLRTSDFTNAPQLLNDIFNRLTDCRVCFNKTTHSVALTEWILNNDPEFLRPLAETLTETLSGACPSSGPGPR